MSEANATNATYKLGAYVVDIDFTYTPPLALVHVDLEHKTLLTEDGFLNKEMGIHALLTCSTFGALLREYLKVELLGDLLLTDRQSWEDFCARHWGTEDRIYRYSIFTSEGVDTINKLVAKGALEDTPVHRVLYLLYLTTINKVYKEV